MKFLSKVSKKTPASKAGDELRPTLLTKPEKYGILTLYLDNSKNRGLC